MVKALLFLSVCGLVGLMMVASAKTSGAGKPVFHKFDFGSYGDPEGIELLNYRYGNSGNAATEPPDWELAQGRVAQSGSIHGAFPVGDSLYVKWRVESTGKVYEDTVNLRDRLPPIMEDNTIHFLIKESQLYVYLIHKEWKAIDAKKCPVKLYADNNCAEIYPGQWQNF